MRDDSGSFRALMPSHNEYRALVSEVFRRMDGGFTVPQEISGKYIDALKGQSTFLRGLRAGSVIPFTSAVFSIPQLVSSTGADYVAEGE